MGGSVRGRGGFRAGRAEGAQPAQQVEPEPRAGRQRHDRDQEADDDEQDLPGGVARGAGNAPRLPPVAGRARVGAGGDRGPADRQPGLGHGRQVGLQLPQACRVRRGAGWAIPRRGGHGRADDAVAVQGAPDGDRVDIEQDDQDRAGDDREPGDVPLVPAGHAVHVVVVPVLDRGADRRDVVLSGGDQRVDRGHERRHGCRHLLFLGDELSEGIA